MSDQSYVTNAPFEAYEGDEPYIFISYKHSDWKKVYPIIKRLNDEGFNIWYDAGLPRGDNYDIEIAKHIKNSELFITFLTREVMNCADDKSDYLIRELSVANNFDKKRLPIYLDDVELDGYYLMHYLNIQSIFRHHYGDDEDLFIDACIRSFRDNFAMEPKTRREDARLATSDLRLFDKLNSTTKSIFDLEGHDVLIVLQDGTNLTSWESVENAEDIIYISEDLSSHTALEMKYANLTSLKAIVVGQISSDVSDMGFMFCGCPSLKDISGLEDWDTANVVNMNSMFYGCSSLSDISGLKDWDVGNVTDMTAMFFGCSELSDISCLKDWNTESVNVTSKMFYRCSALKDITPLNDWNTSNITDMSIMFYGCSALKDVSALSDWDTSNVSDMSIMFYDCYSLNDITGLENWDTEQVTNMNWLFYSCASLNDISSLRNWDTGQVTGMSKMFYCCASLSDVSALKDWDVGNVTDMSEMFYGCTSLDDADPSKIWDID